jgi:hypothetical protein
LVPTHAHTPRAIGIGRFGEGARRLQGGPGIVFGGNALGPREAQGHSFRLWALSLPPNPLPGLRSPNLFPPFRTQKGLSATKAPFLS